MHRKLMTLCALALFPTFVPHAWPQAKRDPLNDEEVDQVREYADHPNDRIKLFTKFIEQRITDIRELSTQKTAENRSARLRARIEEFTRLADELQDNLDTYDQEHADIRKALKDLVPASARWQPALEQPEADTNYDFARKTAIEAAKSVCDQARDLLEEQNKYFAEHKDQAGKNGTGPQ